VKKRIGTRLFSGITVVAALIVLGLLTGALNRFSPDGRIERPAIGAVVTYWALASAALWMVGHARRLWREFLLVVVSLSFIGAISEAVIRLWLPHRALMRLTSIASTRYHHVYPPNRRMSGGKYDGVEVVVVTNADGLRSPYSREEYLTHSRRVAFLGDSFTFGFGVPEERAFPHVIEERLRESLREDVAVLNGGIVSYSPFLATALFDGMVRHYRPQLVFYVLDPSDIGDDVKYANETVASEDGMRFRAYGSREANYYGALFEVARPVVDPLRGFVAYPFAILRHDYSRLRVEIDGVTETSRFFIYRYPLEKTRPYFERTLTHIDRLAEQCRETGARFVLVVSPRYNHWNPKECPQDWETKAGYFSLEDPYPFEYFRFFEEKRDSLDCDVVALLPFFEATEEFPLVFDNDPHWNDRGHRLVAEVLSGYIADNRLIEGLHAP
jgi:hypothetical protein